MQALDVCGFLTMHDALFAVKTVCLHADSARQNANF
jgi:hypothetical protein